MPSSFYGLGIAASGMSVYNTVLNTTAHNISNVKTPGYSRQSVEQLAQLPISLRTAYGMVGSGAQAVSVVSSRDDYYDFKYRKNNSTLGYYSSATYYMDSIQDYLYVNDDKSGGLSTSINEFFTKIKNLTTSPDDKTKRAEVTGYGETIGKYANEMATNLQQMQSDLNSQISTTVRQINAYAKELASLTKQINSLEVYGNRANDLRDQRALILDELSLLADIDVVEKAPAEGNGRNQFIVTLGGGVLVDTYHPYSIEVTSKDTYDNQSDASGLYTLKWNNGQDFAVRSTALGGRLQSLFELRDGNNAENFKAFFNDYSKDDKTITLNSDNLSSENASNLALLSIPESKGVITIGNNTFEYESFNVEVCSDGTYTYTFKLKNELTATDISRLDEMKGNTHATIGDAVEFRGVPYYQAQLNQFLRTFSANFNEVQNKGYDLNGDIGTDFFVGKDITSGAELEMNEFLKNVDDGFYYFNGCKVLDSGVYDSYMANFPAAEYTFEDEADPMGNGKYVKIVSKETGDVTEKVYVPDDDKKIFSFSSTVSKDAVEGNAKVSYYSITALHFAAKNSIVKDGSLLACASADPTNKTGVSEGGNLDLMSALENSNKMFKQGSPTGFLQVMTATIGVDAKKVAFAAVNSENIVNAVDNRRLSTAGVDEDEEGQNMIITQNLLNVQYRVISVMNEVLNKLINETGV